MFFVTEELYPLSVAVDKMGNGTIFTCCHRVPFAKCCCGRATAHRSIIRRDRQSKLNRLLTKATRRGDCCFRPDPMHDGNGNRPAWSHAVKKRSSWNLYAVRAEEYRKRIQDHNFVTDYIVFEEIDAVEPLDTRYDFLG
jgi:hypothetical protein